MYEFRGLIFAVVVSSGVPIEARRENQISDHLCDENKESRSRKEGALGALLFNIRIQDEGEQLYPIFNGVSRPVTNFS
jgi:hypothetical protein